MKKIKFTGKLSLNKETVSKLNNQQMDSVMGGTRTPTCANCPTNNTCPGPTDNGCATFDSCFGTCGCPTDACTTPEFAC